jgi:hypothetical protein
MKKLIESKTSKQELAEYIKKCIKLNEDMVIPYSVDCYEFMCNNNEYHKIKMQKGWEIIDGNYK